MSKPNINATVQGASTGNPCTYVTKVLKSNIPFAEQIGDTNTKYVIKWDFDLGGDTLTIPEGCLIEMDGGTISNGTMVGDHTILIYFQELSDCIKSVTMQGTWKYNNPRDGIFTENVYDEIQQKTQKQVNSDVAENLGTLDDKIDDKTDINATFSDDGKIYSDYHSGDIFYVEWDGVRKYRVAYFDGTADAEHPITIDGFLFYYADNATDAVWYSLRIKTVSTSPQILTSNQKVQAQNNIVGKSYVPAEFSGLGRKVLAKNMQTIDSVEKNIMTQALFEDGQGNPLTNTVFVIQHDYEIDNDITLPENCFLEFDGGSISGDYAIDFSNLKTEEIYSSWMSQSVLRNSLRYMSHKKLIIDKTIELSSPLTCDTFVNSLEISGEIRTKYLSTRTKSTLVCGNFTAIDLKGFNINIHDLIIVRPRDYQHVSPLVKLDTYGDDNNDLDSVIHSCTFDIYNNSQECIIESHGRGLTVRDCEFVGSPLSYINCYLKHSDNPKWDDTDNYAGRKIWIRNNNVHGSAGGPLVSLLKNSNVPDATFKGVKIENNSGDIGGCVVNITAKCSDLTITNNTFAGVKRSDITFLNISNSKNVVICNNIFSGINTEDLPNNLNIDKQIIISSDIEGFVPENYIICNNILATNRYAIFCGKSIKSLIFESNTLISNSFSYNGRKGLIRIVNDVQQIKIANNIYTGANTNIYALYLGDNSYRDAINRDILISNNSGMENEIWPGDSDISTWVLDNIKVLGIAEPASLTGIYKKINLESLIGNSYIDTSLSPAKPIWWNGTAWVDATGATV